MPATRRGCFLLQRRLYGTVQILRQSLFIILLRHCISDAIGSRFGREAMKKPVANVPWLRITRRETFAPRTLAHQRRTGREIAGGRPFGSRRILQEQRHHGLLVFMGRSGLVLASRRGDERCDYRKSKYRLAAIDRNCKETVDVQGSRQAISRQPKMLAEAARKASAGKCTAEITGRKPAAAA